MNRLLTALICACALLATLYALLHFGGNASPRAIAVNEPLQAYCEEEWDNHCLDDDAPSAGSLPAADG